MIVVEARWNGGLIGLIDDVLNLYGKSAVAGLRAPVKFAMIAAVNLCPTCDSWTDFMPASLLFIKQF